MDKTILKQWFSKGKKPLASHFAAWIDSFWHKDEQIPIAAISDLDNVISEFETKPSVDEKLSLKSDEGHVHNREEITDFEHQHQLSDISGINDVTVRGYTLDFGTTLELVQDANVIGDITINRIVSRNTTALYVSYGDVVRQQVNPNGEVNIEIPDGAILNWEIIRGAEDALACVGVRYNIKIKEE